MVLRCAEGYWTIATWWVNWASRRTVRVTRSLTSRAPAMKALIAFRSAAESGFMVASLSTKSR